MDYCYIVEQVENNVAYTSTQQNASSTPISTPSQTAHNAAVRKQQQAQADNATQSAAFWALRGGGKAEAAAQMENPISTQTYNTKQGVYVVEGQSTSNLSRAAAEQRTLDLALQKQRQQKEETEKMSIINTMVSTSSNSSVMPSSNAQNQFGPQQSIFGGSLEFIAKNMVSNNNVNPLSLYGPQPVNTNGQGQNSSVNSNSIVTNANYNYATDMNNYQNSNPMSDINMDIGERNMFLLINLQLLNLMKLKLFN